MIARVGELTGKAEQAVQVAGQISKAFQALPRSAHPFRTLYLIWREPYMSIGQDTFIHHTLQRCGLHNVCVEKSRYPELTADEIKELQPELILLSSEPYPFKDKHVEELKGIVPHARVMLVDGEMFSWYGSRLLQAAAYLSDFVKTIA